MKTIKWLMIAAVVSLVTCIGCSKETREDVADSVEDGTRKILGLSDQEKTPRVVRDQQRKERIRQNNTWTPENRARHPVEYCQSQLEDLQRYSRELEARAHEKSCTIAEVKRTIADNEAMERSLNKFIIDAKKTYRECEAANSWPAKLGGYTLSREKTQEKLIDATQKLSEVRTKTASKKNQLVALEKTLKTTQDEQKRIVKLREQIQNTINDLRVKKVIEGDDSIVASLNAIEDNMGALGVDYDDPKIESIIQPDEKTTREELFKKIMAD